MNWIARFAVSLGLLLIASLPAQAGFIVNFGPGGGTNNAGDMAIAQAQMTLEVFDRGTNASGVQVVGFRFHNSGPHQSTIAAIGFEDGTLLGQLSPILYSNSGIAFSPGGAPNFPFLSNYLFFEDSANSPSPKNGINPGEWAEFQYALINGKTYQDTINALQMGFGGAVPDPANPGRHHSLRIGIHVRNFASGGSEKLVTVGDVNPVPAPPVAVLLLSAVPFLALTRLRRREQVTA
jgi:hypothetical protein